MTSYSSKGSARPDGAVVTEHQSATSPLVLIVEDHADTRFLLRYFLEMRGCRVLEAEDGEEAVRRATALKPDLVLMDAGLPGADGLSTTRRMRERDELRTVPIVFLSGHDGPTWRAVAFAAGCCDYLVKPLGLDQLERVLEQRLNLKPQKRHTPTEGPRMPGARAGDG